MSVYLCYYSSMQLTNEQHDAFLAIKDHFLKQSTVLLCGSAGTGKTTLTKTVASHYLEQGGVCAIAPTHKARHVLESALNDGGLLLPVPTFTVASILSKLKEHSYIGTKTYSNPNNKKFDAFRFFILDEVSMCSDKDVKYIVAYVSSHGKKLLLVGDKYQIPNPSASFMITPTSVQKLDSYIFTDSNIPCVELLKVIRQAKGSPILKLACFIRDNINDSFELTLYPNLILEKALYHKYRSLYSQAPESTKIIAYTNQAVRTHNIEARRILGYQERFVVGDILTGYANMGWPELLVENGQDYIVESCEYTKSKSVAEFNLCGNYVTLLALPKKGKSKKLFFLDVSNEQNASFLKELIARAEKVNAMKSSKTDFMRYNELKSHIVCMEDLYEYQGVVFEETDFKEMHSLLFTKTLDVIKELSSYSGHNGYELARHDQETNNGRIIIKSPLSTKIQSAYGNIISLRIRDDKIISDSETLADQFKAIEKDIFYGYSITAHKSQGSTYENVFMDDTDFLRITDRFNYKYSKLELRTKERNQLRYVAVTRAKRELYIIQDLSKIIQDTASVPKHSTTDPNKIMF